jgi:hypothetical protein
MHLELNVCGTLSKQDLKDGLFVESASAKHRRTETMKERNPFRNVYVYIASLKH